MRSLTPQNYQAIKQLQRLYTDKVQGLIESGCELGKFRVADARVATFVLLQMLTSVARWYHPRGRLSEDDLIDVYKDLAFAMLGAVKFRPSSASRDDGPAHLNGAPQSDELVTHSFDIGGHILRVSIASHAKTRGARDESRKLREL
jgi:hypothetical protein